MNAPQNSSRKLRLILGVSVALVSVVSYFASSTKNALTGQVQQVSLTPQQEVQLGLAAAPELTQQYGGASDAALTRYVASVGQRVASRSSAAKTGYQFRFVVLADRTTINAFALPGGPVFITEALLLRLGDEAQLAGVLGHEIGHVVARHGAQRLAKAELTQGLVLATGVAADDHRQAELARAVGALVVMKYGRDDELESDALGVRLMAEAGYDAAAMLDVLRVLKQSATGGRQPEFFSTHPDPDNRLEAIAAAVQEMKSGGERNEAAFRAAVLEGGAAQQPSARPKAGPRLPPEALRTLELIDQGGPFPFERDGITFHNREGALPEKPSGYYREYTVETPGVNTRGARRIITGKGGERFYTDDHYETFAPIR